MRDRPKKVAIEPEVSRLKRLRFPRLKIRIFLILCFQPDPKWDWDFDEKQSCNSQTYWAGRASRNAEMVISWLIRRIKMVLIKKAKIKKAKIKKAKIKKAKIKKAKIKKAKIKKVCAP
jgi:hypothetical protein